MTDTIAHGEADPTGSLIPISDEQAKAIQEALKTLRGFDGYLKQTLGTVPEDIVGLLGGDWLKVRRAENLVCTVKKMRERLRARGVEPTEPLSLSLLLPILVAAAEESRDELQDMWARLLAAAADPSRAKAFRIAFIEAVKKMDPLDASVLQSVQAGGGGVRDETRNSIAAQLHVSRDEVDVSIANLEKLDLLNLIHGGFQQSCRSDRELLRTVSN